MVAGLTRRDLIGGGAAFAAALAGAPWVRRALAEEPLAAILAASRLGAASGLAVMDLASGRLLEAHQADLDRPPASVVKIVTALYARAVLGPGHRFATSVVADGGALWLVGGGDPGLDTDALGDLAGRAAAAGLAAPRRFRVAAGALPEIAVTEADQPAHVGYNPAVSGLNLNFNRVYLEWKPGGGGPALALSAPGVRYAAPVRVVRAELGGRGWAHRLEGGAEVWQMAPFLARGEGNAWLPVRRPAAYAADVFGTLAGRAGLALGAPEPGGGAAGELVARHESAPLDALLGGMLRHSTNLTAEAAGLAATGAGGRRAESLAASGAAMAAWARARYGLARADFANHSGLTVRSHMTAGETVRLLAAGAREGLPELLRDHPVGDAKGAPIPGLSARAKTGTLHWVRGLAGYLERRGGGRLAFAILAADLAARDGADLASGEPPPGARGWLGRARDQEQALLRRWGALYL